MPNHEIAAAIAQRGKFVIEQEFTEGQNAYAFKAFHTQMNRYVFLKLYPYSEALKSEILREPRTLVEAMRSSRSDNVVELFDAEILSLLGEDYVCLQMEFVDGESLCSMLTKSSIGQQDAVRITTGILNGLSHLHSRRILHRDLKPANILVSATNVPKIADFGSVAILPESMSAVTASKHSALYVPPEGSTSLPTYTFTSDLYQVGMVLYELVNGPLCYDFQHYLTKENLSRLERAGLSYSLKDDCDRSLTVDAIIRYLAERGKLLEFGRPPRPYFSPKLRKIVVKACKPDPAARFPSSQVFCSQLAQSNVPNWRIVSKSTFRAERWKKWDWEVTANNEIMLRKSQLGKNSFRRIPNQDFSTVEEAFNFVETHR